MQAYANAGKASTEVILGPPPRSGSISVYAQKIAALAFVWLCALVLFGHSSNVSSSKHPCGSTCTFQIIMGVVIWLFTTVLLLFNYLCLRGTMQRTGFFSHGLEVQLIAILVLLWIPVIGAVSTVANHGASFAAPILTIWFSWLGFFGSLFGTFKAYHNFKEEDLPTPIPFGFDEEEVVYG